MFIWKIGKYQIPVYLIKKIFISKDKAFGKGSKVKWLTHASVYFVHF